MREELLNLSAVELRRRIGTKEISPVELLEACIERIERINPAVNAVTAMCYERARKEAKAAERAVMRGDALGLLHGLPAGIKDLDETGGLLTTYGSPLYRDFVPERDSAMVARVRAAGADRRGQDQRAGIRRRREQPQRRLGRDRQSIRSDAQCGRLVGRLCRRARVRHAAAVHGLGYRRLAAHSRRDMRRRRLSAVAGTRARGAARAGLDADLGRRPDGAHRRGRVLCSWLRRQRWTICDPLSYPVDARRFAMLEACDLGVAARRVHRRLRRLPGGSADPQGLSRQDRGDAAPVPVVRRSEIRLRRGRPLLRRDSCGRITSAQYRDAYEKDPSTLGPNVRANYEIGGRR